MHSFLIQRKNNELNGSEPPSVGSKRPPERMGTFDIVVQSAITALEQLEKPLLGAV